MFKVTYQLHGCPEVYEKVFQVGFDAHHWARMNTEVFCMVYVSEVFH
jgi:hypothetical protein